MSLPGPISSSALNSLSPLSPPGCSSRGVWRMRLKTRAFPYSEETICSYPIIICHNSYLTAFVWFTLGVMVHVIRTRHCRLVLHCKCNHFFEEKHLSLYPSHPHTPTATPFLLIPLSDLRPPLHPMCITPISLYILILIFFRFCGLFTLESDQMKLATSRIKGSQVGV